MNVYVTRNDDGEVKEVLIIKSEKDLADISTEAEAFTIPDKLVNSAYQYAIEHNKETIDFYAMYDSFDRLKKFVDDFDEMIDLSVAKGWDFVEIPIVTEIVGKFLNN